MTFDELLAQVVELLQHQGRVSYGALKRRFALDDDYLQDLKDELIDAQRVAVDEEGKVLVWVGASPVSSLRFQVSGSQPLAPSTQHPDSRRQTLDPRLIAGERRQLTVMFCDLVGSTALSTQLDPEELRAVIQAYRETCATVIRRFDGHLAKYIGDGLLVYFGYPLAHEDDAQRAVRAGLGIVGAIHELPLPHTRLQQPIQVRIGIHTGLVVAGEMGVGDQPEPLAIVGETPNLAARLQQEAQPNTVVISAATYHLIQGYFECADLGLREVKGVLAPLQVYCVLGESGVQGRLEVAASRGLTPLVGREPEVRLLLECWEQVKEGRGQVVLLSGEAGIGKSRLVRVLRERIAGEAPAWLECRCSPYHQNSALYPLIDLLQRVLGFKREDSPEEKLSKLEAALEVGAIHELPLQSEVVPLFASLLSLPLPERYPPLNLTPQRQKQKTLEAVLTWLLAEAERQPVPFIVEDPHWADPSTLEFLGLLIDQVPTARLLALLAFRPEFTPPWPPRSHLTHLTLHRLPRKQVEEIVEKITGDKALPAAVVQQIVAKTDGVPLFVEELTKMVVESGLDVGAQHAAPSSALGIPATLHDALMARLDRLGPTKEIAQVGATLGREFSYELLQAVSLLDEAVLQQGLRQLVEAELIYQRGLPPQATYFFKHALIQDAAYQSLLKSTRRQYHQQIAQMLEERFPETTETQPELLAHHYTEAGLGAHAIAYWQRAGEHAVQRSANAEAINHLTKGLELLKTLPDTPERTQQELTLQLALGTPLMATKGYSSPEVGQAYARARELCQQIGEIPQLFPVLMGLWVFYTVGTDLQTAHELAEQCLRLADRVQDPGLLLEAHVALGPTLFYRGELTAAHTYLEHGITLYDPQQHRSHAFVYGTDPGVPALGFAARTLCLLGYLDQARQRGNELLAMTQRLSAHHNSLGADLMHLTVLHLLLQDGHTARERAETLITLATEHELSLWLGMATMLRGAALVEEACLFGRQEEVEKGIVQLRQGVASYRSTGAGLDLSPCLVLLAKGYGEIGQPQEGLNISAEVFAIVNNGGERYYEAEMYRLKGELTLQKFQVSGSRFQAQESSKSEVRGPESEAEECFLKAIEIARQQQAKSLELRAVMSLSRLWQSQGKKEEAHRMLAEIYSWFTEGFDTKDLQEAKALIEELS